MNAEQHAHLRELLKLATPGPWIAGDAWRTAGLLPECGPGRCTYCASFGAPVRTGPMDINGTVMAAHIHRDPEPYDTDHRISGPPDTTVAGNYDYEAGGIVEPADTALVVAMRNSIEGLLDEIAELRRGLDRIADRDPIADDDFDVAAASGHVDSRFDRIVNDSQTVAIATLARADAITRGDDDA